MPDKVLAGLTARQVAIAATAAAVLWLALMAARHVMPLPVFAALAAPAAARGCRAGDRERDGLPLDRLLAAAWRQARSPRRLVTAPEGIPAPPAWAPAARPAGPAAGAAAAAVAGRLARRGDRPGRRRRRRGRRGSARSTSRCAARPSRTP